MRHPFVVTGAAGLVCLLGAAAHAQETGSAIAKPEKVRIATYIHVNQLPLTAMIPAPPVEGSEAATAEFRELHRIQDARTPDQVKAAQADEGEEDIFIYRTVLGAG